MAILVIFENMANLWTSSMNGMVREMDYKNKSCNDGIIYASLMRFLLLAIKC